MDNPDPTIVVEVLRHLSEHAPTERTPTPHARAVQELIAAARDHKPMIASGAGLWCVVCDTNWPCPTHRKALEPFEKEKE